jgi:hypothetical protein
MTASGLTSIRSGATLEVASGGTATFAGTINNSGTLFASGSHSLVDIANGTIVNGGGIAEVGNGTVDIQTTADGENVSFLSGGSGVLELDETAADPAAYGGTISGFGQNTHQYIDLTTITSGANVRLSYSSNTAGSGVLTVTSGGSRVAEINMSGHYTTANFHLVSGPGGTVEIYDPPVGAQQSGWSGSPQISFDTVLGSSGSWFLSPSANMTGSDTWGFDSTGGLPTLTASLASELSNMGMHNPKVGSSECGGRGIGSSEWSYASNHSDSIGGSDHDGNLHTKHVASQSH